TAQALLHLRDLARRDAEVGRDGLRLALAEPAEVLLGLAQIEEQLALRLRRRDADQAPVAQHELVDLGADPMDRERNEPYDDVRVEPPDGLHEADVALLNEVGELEPVARIAACDVDDEAQMRQDELFRG